MYERTYNKRVLKQDSGPKEKKKFPWKRVLVVFGVLALLVGFVFFTRIPAFQVKNVVVEGTHVAAPEDVSQFVLGKFEGYALKVFPRGSIILISTDSLEKEIKRNFSRFKEVSVGRGNLHELKVLVSEYEGVYVWCAEGMNPDDCMFMDELGVVFAPAPYFSGSAYKKVFVGIEGELPFKPISDVQLGMMKTLIERLEAISVDPYTFHFVSEDELYVTFDHNGRESKIIFDPKDDLENSLESLFSGMRVESFSEKYHTRGSILEYIDLRFSNKMVYKFQ